jgi:hypothetical protein
MAGEPTNANSLSRIDDLLRDSRLVYDYCNSVGGIDVDALIAAINAVEALTGDDRVPSAAAVIELRKQYAQGRTQMPFDVFYSLRNGWTIFPPRSKKWVTAGVVGLAIVFMICVLHLTRIYNRGVDLSAELSVLEASQAERRYGELERKLLDARQRLFPISTSSVAVGSVPCGVEESAAPCNGAQGGASTNIDEKYLLAREASHLMVFELVNLDQRIKDVNVRMGEFQEQARYPIVGMGAIEYSLSKFQSGAWAALVSWFGCPAGSTAKDGGCTLTQSSENDRPAQEEGAKTAVLAASVEVVRLQAQALPETPARHDGTQAEEQQRPAYDTLYDPRLSGMSEVFCRKVNLLEDYVSGQLSKDELASKDAFLGKLTYSLGDTFGVSTAGAIIQNCALGLSYYSGAIPDIEAINMRVKDKLNLYSMIILPAVYGALGAIVFFMRPLLNPRLPNPGMTHTLYRIALGALAGMILAWLGMGMFGTDEAFKSVGLGLFAVAFILGFSIDVFFDLLDRLVGISRGAVKKIGSPASDAIGTSGATGGAGTGGAAPS